MERLVMFADAFTDKTALVTGHTGFKGAWLAIWLERLGARVVGYALRPPTSPSLFESCALATRLTHIEADIRDTARVIETIKEHQPSFIFHLAAAPLVRESYAKPLETFDVNLMGTLSLLEAVRACERPCAVVLVSSDKCYDNIEADYAYRETDRLGGHDPYSASKAAMEIAVASYRLSYFPVELMVEHGVRIATARAGNVIGGGDWSKDRIVPDAVRALSRGEPLEVRNPSAVRPWQHVLEPLAGYLWLAARLASAEGARFASAWNFGPLPTDTRTVRELADAFTQDWGGAWRAAEEANAPHEAGLLMLSTEKARSHLEWRPIWDFDTAVARTVAWYRAFDAGPASAEKNHLLCVSDIAAHESGAKGLRWAS